MSTNAKLQITLISERELRWKRDFKAPLELVFAAFTRPELVRRWLLGPPGWEMTACEIDLRVGGSYRYAWKHAEQGSMAIQGEYREIVAPRRLVVTERFEEPWYPGDAVGTLELTHENGITTMTNTMLYESIQARDIALQSNMEYGLSMGYGRLEASLEGTLAVDRFVAESAHASKDLIVALRACALAAYPGLGEQIKWNAPSFHVDGTHVVTLNLSKSDRVLVVFHRGSRRVEDDLDRPLIDDPNGWLRWAANDRATVEFRRISEFRNDEETFLRTIRAWIPRALERPDSPPAAERRSHHEKS